MKQWSKICLCSHFLHFFAVVLKFFFVVVINGLDGIFFKRDKTYSNYEDYLDFFSFLYYNGIINSFFSFFSIENWFSHIRAIFLFTGKEQSPWKSFFPMYLFSNMRLIIAGLKFHQFMYTNFMLKLNDKKLSF